MCKNSTKLLPLLFLLISFATANDQSQKLQDTLAQQRNPYWRWENTDTLVPNNFPTLVTFTFEKKSTDLLSIQKKWIEAWKKDLGQVAPLDSWDILITRLASDRRNVRKQHDAIIRELTHVVPCFPVSDTIIDRDIPSVSTVIGAKGEGHGSPKVKGQSKITVFARLKPEYRNIIDDNKLEKQAERKRREQFVPYKPAIYLYPDSMQLTKVTLQYNGALTLTYPSIDTTTSSWTVWTEPDGALGEKKGQKQFRYLYWEGDANLSCDMETHYDVVKSTDLQNFLDSNLTKAGLNSFEKQDFISYWAGRFLEYPYVKVHLADSSEYDVNALLEITPPPSYINRIFVFFEPLQSKPAQSTTTQNWNRPQRQGYSVIEWGGTIVTPPMSSNFDPRLTIFFEPDTYQVSLQSRHLLELFAMSYLKEIPLKKIRVSGHTGPKGSSDYNFGLGQREAGYVADLLRQYGVPESNIQTISYGEEQPPEAELVTPYRVIIDVVE